VKNLICTHQLQTWGLTVPEVHHALCAEFDRDMRLTAAFVVLRGRKRRLVVSEDFAERLEYSEGYADEVRCPLARAKAYSARVLGAEVAA
jgi:hypothetical protein